ncbi:MAG: lysophospholipid acyltransferase family protein [Bacilli bacterium]|nr:lysophospholipid acyltransferase family protein [Bacillales bacterium]MDY2746806.1 lysophospholipid acyltransferase family protein [Bacilli bacterium]
MKKKKWCKVRHKFWFTIMRPIFSFLFWKKYGYKAENYKLDRKQNYLIICNHSCSLDPFMLGKSFFRPIYFVASDDLLKNGFISKIMKHTVAPIPIRKGTMDISSIRNCISIAKEGGTIGIFPEGNRTYSGEISYLGINLVKFIRKLDLPLIIYHIDGGYGLDPRWGKKSRRGKGSRGYVQRLLSKEELCSLKDEELLKIINTNLSQEISPSLRFKSKEKAEYLERVLFVCPKCHALETLVSEKNAIKCKCCSLEATYEEDLSFSSNEPSFKFKKVSEWMNYQKEYLKDLDIEENKVLLGDENVTLISCLEGKEKEVELVGKLQMNSKSFIIKGEKELQFFFKDIKQVENQGKHKLLFYIGKDYYEFKGGERFSSYKYYLMFNRINNTLENTL